MALRLGDILVEKNIITQEELNKAINEQRRTGEILGQILVRMGIVPERKMLQVLAEQQGIPFVDLKEININEKVIKNVPAKFAWHYKVMPINIEGNVLTVAIANPFDVWPIDDLETNLGFRVEKALSTSTDILEAIRKYYGVGAETIESILAEKPHPAEETESVDKEKVEDLEKMAEDASVVKLVNQIFQEAINKRATDIHVEHFRDELVLRYRIDGILYNAPVSESIKYLNLSIVSRIKIMSGLDIVERRMPQDGRTKVKIGNSEYELRVSIIPTLYGENIVVRILPTKVLFNMSDLGMCGKDLDIMEKLIKKPHGIIFVTGPTGSGKSTTLYVCLTRLNTAEVKIVTIEDPIEYELRGISQTQINPKIDLTFARMLRSMLRHDPDIMMVGEVRDFETAEITIQTALTGHLVFSTFHTNDAASGITRLVNIGIEPYLVASSVEAFIAQRLVRVICGKCKEKINLSGELKSILAGSGLDASLYEGKSVFRGKGCKICNNTGYIGRIGIYEILVMNNEIKEMVLQKVSSEEIKEKAISFGMRTLKQDGLEKVLAGITTPEEVMRVTQLEE